MNVYTIHFYKSGDIRSRGLKIAKEAEIVALSPNSLLVASELSEKEIIKRMEEAIVVLNQTSTGYVCSREISAQTKDKIDHILNSGPPTVLGSDL